MKKPLYLVPVITLSQALQTVKWVSTTLRCKSGAKRLLTIATNESESSKNMKIKAKEQMISVDMKSQSINTFSIAQNK